MKNNLKSFTISAIIASSLGVLAVSLPNSFTAGTPIKAADMNANFSSLKASLDALEAAPKVIVPFSVVGTGLGLANATLQAKNTAGGVAAVISQDKTGTSDTALAIGNSGNGPLIKGYMNNGGENEFQVDGNGSVHLFTPEFKDNILLDNSNGNISATGNVFAKGVQLTSDKNAKTNFSSVSALNVLEKVMALPIQAWNYKTDAAKVRHIGPMAQDFHAVFGLNGTDDKHISSIDEQGVALAAIQRLNLKLEQRNAKIKQLESKLASFEARLLKLEQK